MVDRNKKAVNKAKFEAVTDEIAKQEYVDYTKSEIILCLLFRFICRLH